MVGKKTRKLGVSMMVALSLYSYSFALDNSMEVEYINAVKNNNIPKIVNILSEGLDVNVRDEKTGWTALHYASDRKIVARFLIDKGAKLNAINNDVGSQISKYWIFMGQMFWAYLFSVMDSTGHQLIVSQKHLTLNLVCAGKNSVTRKRVFRMWNSV